MRKPIKKTPTYRWIQCHGHPRLFHYDQQSASPHTRLPNPVAYYGNDSLWQINVVCRCSTTTHLSTCPYILLLTFPHGHLHQKMNDVSRMWMSTPLVNARPVGWPNIRPHSPPLCPVLLLHHSLFSTSSCCSDARGASFNQKHTTGHQKPPKTILPRELGHNLHHKLARAFTEASTVTWPPAGATLSWREFWTKSTLVLKAENLTLAFSWSLFLYRGIIIFLLISRYLRLCDIFGGYEVAQCSRYDIY